MFRTTKRKEHGSALLVSLMVMVGLSLLGLGFVAVTETESSIASNERNSVQAQFAAETGARAVVEMFQDSAWAQKNGILPQNITAFKTRRTFPSNPTKDGYYKPNGTHLLFDKPFKGADYGNRFFGDGDVNPPTADIWIYYGKNSQSDTYLNQLNTALFLPDVTHNERVRISDIRVYAPPIPGATRNANNFWDDANAARYGVATIRVTAQKLNGGRVVAERSVKTVLAETPFPTVDGAIETSGTLVGQGSFEVYWGKVLSEKGIELKRAVAGMPWFDAKNQMNFEYGFDSARVRQPNTPYTAGLVTVSAGDVVLANATALAADPELLKFAYKATAVSGNTDPGDPAAASWPKTIGDSWTDGGVTWTAIAARSFPIGLEPDPELGFYSAHDWFYQLLERNVPDPWLHARARQEIIAPNNPPCGDAVSFHPCDYNDEMHDVQSYFSNMFQYQTTTESGPAPKRVEAVFPTMDYEFWKNVAMSSNNDAGVYYFKYADPQDGNHNEFIGPGGRRESIYFWLNALQNQLGAGFYFFDTRNAKNPQFGKGGTLTPAIDINAGSVDDPFQMQGYIYLNAEFFGTSGAGDITPDDVYPMPGEPFRDVGFREVVEGVTPFAYNLVGGTGVLPDADYVWLGRNNGVWDFQDINQNAQFDLFLEERSITRPDGNATMVWMPVPFFEGCTPGDNSGAIPGANCSEPHEPYINITYTPAFAGLNPTTGVTLEYYDPSTTGAAITNYRRPKLRTGTNETVTCTVASSAAECTSNLYDADGGLAKLQALLWGALYSEGGYSGSGNVVYYGALLMRSSFEATGTPTVYFNECLARGCLEDQLDLQRVTVTSWQTD